MGSYLSFLWLVLYFQMKAASFVTFFFLKEQAIFLKVFRVCLLDNTFMKCQTLNNSGQGI